MYIQRRRVSRLALSGLGDDVTDATLVQPGDTLSIPGEGEVQAGIELGVMQNQIDQMDAIVAAAAAQAAAANLPYAVVQGVCVAMGANNLAACKEMQRQINRALTGAKSSPMIAIDGTVGSQTSAALSRLAAAGVVSAGLLGSCGTIWASVAGFTVDCKQFADAKGVSSSVGSPSPGATPTFINPATAKLEQQGPLSSVTDAFKRLSTIEQVAVAAALGGVGLLAFGKKKKGSKR